MPAPNTLVSPRLRLPRRQIGLCANREKLSATCVPRQDETLPVPAEDRIRPIASRFRERAVVRREGIVESEIVEHRVERRRDRLPFHET